MTRGCVVRIELLAQKVEVNKMIKAIDLFAGAGGLSYGFYLTGEYELVAAAEINENARATYKQNIAKRTEKFEFINNVIGYNFSALNQRKGGQIDIVIGGPPCQGFSNANRHKNHLISMNNSLVKEYFRAIKQIKPKAFVMENVSMLESDTHRFYDSYKDNAEIEALIAKGFKITKRKDSLVLADRVFADIDLEQLPQKNLVSYDIPSQLKHLLSVLRKNLGNDRRLPNFWIKNALLIKRMISEYLAENQATTDNGTIIMRNKLSTILTSLEEENWDTIKTDLDYVVDLQKLIEFIREITSNELIGTYDYSEEHGLRFITQSYSVIDYVNAILGNEYIQKGNVFNAEWFGIPQERRRYIVLGIRKDIYDQSGKELDYTDINKAEVVPTVGDAIADLTDYEVGYDKKQKLQRYKKDDDLCEYAVLMRTGSEGVKNHITTKTTEKVLDRFRKIKQGKNFHSLNIEDKDTYSKPERTQNTIYLRLDPNKPSGTVVNVRKSMWIHPTLDRAISVREAARLQSFPDSFVFIGTKDSQYQQVGNAVPPLLAKGIAEILLEYLK